MCEVFKTHSNEICSELGYNLCYFFPRISLPLLLLVLEFFSFLFAYKFDQSCIFFKSCHQQEEQYSLSMLLHPGEPVSFRLNILVAV